MSGFLECGHIGSGEECCQAQICEGELRETYQHIQRLETFVRTWRALGGVMGFATIDTQAAMELSVKLMEANAAIGEL